MRIDVHSHFLPPRFFAAMAERQAFDRLETFAFYGPRLGEAAKRQFAGGEAAFVARWIEEMDAAQVDLTVAGLGALQPYFPDAATAADATRVANSILADAVALGEGRVAAFASLPLPHTDAALAEIASRLDESGFVGVNLGCSAGGRPLDDASFDEVWAALDERATTVYIHPGATPRMGIGLEEFGLAALFAGPSEIGVALCRLALRNVGSRYPRITFIGAVLGGTIPHLARRLDGQLRKTEPDLYEELGGLLPQLRRFWYDTSFEDLTALEAVRRTLGVDRLVLGSDTPRDPVSTSVRLLEATELLTAAEKTQILDCNGAEALALDAAPARPARRDP